MNIDRTKITIINWKYKHWDSAYLCQGTSYLCHKGSGSLSRSPPKFNPLFARLLPTFPENFMQIRSEVFVQSC